MALAGMFEGPAVPLPAMMGPSPLSLTSYMYNTWASMSSHSFHSDSFSSFFGKHNNNTYAGTDDDDDGEGEVNTRRAGCHLALVSTRYLLSLQAACRTKPKVQGKVRLQVLHRIVIGELFRAVSLWCTLVQLLEYWMSSKVLTTCLAFSTKRAPSVMVF